MVVGDYIKYLPIEVTSNLHSTVHLAIYPMSMRKNPVKRYLHPIGPDTQGFKLAFNLEEQHRLSSDPLIVPVWDQHLWATVEDPGAKLAQPEVGEFIGQQLMVTVEPSVSFAKGQVQWAIMDVPSVPPVLKRTSAPSVAGLNVDMSSRPSSSLRPPPSPDSVITATGSRKTSLQSRAALRPPPSPDQPVRTSVSSTGSRGMETSSERDDGVKVKLPTPTTGIVHKFHALLYRLKGQELFFMLIKGAPGNAHLNRTSKWVWGGN
jgi:hypothetical protein